MKWRNEMEFFVYDEQADDGKKFIVIHCHLVGEDNDEDEKHPPSSYTNLWPSLENPFHEDMMVWQVNIRHTLETEPRVKVTVKVGPNPEHRLNKGWDILNDVRIIVLLIC